MTARQIGDEPMMLLKRFRGPVAVARRRIDAIKLIANDRLAEAVLLDDAFQHLRLRRDLDLLLFNQSVGLGNGWLLPAGPLREPKAAIARADVLILIEPLGAQVTSICHVLRWMKGKPILHARVQPSSLTYSDNGTWRDAPMVLDRRRVMAVSGIANPGVFHAMLRALGAQVLRTLDYPDHHQYTASDWEHILAGARDVDMLITTEKDLVKLEHFGTGGIPLYALHLNVTMEAEDEGQLLDLVTERIGRPVRRTWALGKELKWQ